jgi:hypothetical protein
MKSEVSMIFSGDNHLYSEISAVESKLKYYFKFIFISFRSFT